MKTATTAIYARISLDRQDGAGVDRQLEDCRKLAKTQGWTPVREFVENNASAFSKKLRPKYQEMLAAVKAGAINRILVYNIDRLYRQPKELEEIIQLGERGRLAVVTCNSGDLGLGDDVGDGLFMARLLVNVANKASRDTGRRVRRAKQQAREKGLPMGGPRPFGWKAAPAMKNGQPVLNRRGLPRMTWRSDEPDPAEAQLLIEAVDELLAGASLNDIARKWNDAGVGQPQTGRANWQADTVRQVVSNPRNAGLVGYRQHQVDAEGRERYQRPVVVGKGKWPIIVNPERWERLQALLAHRAVGYRIPRRRSLLTGLVLCGACGYVMSRTGARGHVPGGTVRRVLRCSAALKIKGKDGAVTGEMHRGCGRLSIDAEGLEAWLTEATLVRADSSGLAKIVRQQGPEGKEAATIVTKLDELTRREDEAAESHGKGRLPLRAFEKMTTIIERDRHDLQLRLGQLTSTSAAVPFVGKPGVLRAKWPSLGLDQRRAIISAVLGQVRVMPAVRPGRPRFDPDRVQIIPRKAA